MKIIIVDNSWQEKWDEFAINNSLDFGLLQSWAWGEFQESLGRKIFRLAVIDKNEQISALAQIIKQPLKLGKIYFYIPRGPVLRLAGEEAPSSKLQVSNKLPTTNYKLQTAESLFSEIKKLAKKENAVFLRFDPAWFLDPELPNLKQVGQVQPKKTLILDLKKTEDQILVEMKAKTRYNIKVAEKHGLKIEVSPTPSEILPDGKISSPPRAGGEISFFEDFWRLTKQTAKRQEIRPHAKDYYQKMLATLGKKGTIKLFVAKDQGKIIAANLVVFFGRFAAYLHGASDYESREKMAPYLLQWAAIREAKNQGQEFYDFWGVDEKKWPGVTRFKIGFAPQENFVEYVGARDEVYQKFWYNLYRIYKR